jgi:hypothetical protein
LLFFIFDKVIIDAGGNANGIFNLPPCLQSYVLVQHQKGNNNKNRRCGAAIKFSND